MAETLGDHEDMEQVGRSVKMIGAVGPSSETPNWME